MSHSSFSPKPFVAVPNELASHLDERGYKLEINNGFNHYDWVLYKETPFSKNFLDYVAYKQVTHGIGSSVDDCVRNMLLWLQEEFERVTYS